MNRDNQQQRLGWLAGILEGEGNISLQFGKRGDGSIQIFPRIQITNKDINLLNHALSIINENGCGARIRYAGKWKSGCYHLLIEGIKRCRKFVDIIEPCLVTKRDRLEVLKNFLDSRLSKPIREKYSQYDWYCFSQLRGLNGKAMNHEIDDFIQSMLRDYTLNTKIGEDIVRTTTKVVETDGKSQ